MNWRKYIISDSKILMGKPTIKGTRISVELILELFSKGWTESQILETYPTISKDSIRAVFAYLQSCIQTGQKMEFVSDSLIGILKQHQNLTDEGIKELYLKGKHNA